MQHNLIRPGTEVLYVEDLSCLIARLLERFLATKSVASPNEF